MEDEPLKDAPRAPVAAPIFRPPKMVSRPKPPQQQEEELGAEPRLGDFEGDNPLSISEARAVVTAVHSARKRKDAASNPLGGDRAHNDSQTITQFVEYLETFSKYKHTDNLHALAGLMVSHNEISGVEKAMLGSLACDTSDEAKTLVPSLANKIDDESLQTLLDEMSKLQDRFG